MSVLLVRQFYRGRDGLPDRLPRPEGGPGEIKTLRDDGVPPGPGEEENERQDDEFFCRRVLLLEETIVRRGREGQGKDRDGRGG